MAKQFPAINDAHDAFIARQHVFFVASAAPGTHDGLTHVNVSPRPMTSFRRLDAGTVGYLDRTGSGNETAAHIRAGGRVTIMFCAFEGAPSIMRLYGRGRVLDRRGAAFAGVLAGHFGGVAPSGTRQIVTLAVELVQTSCGYGVPFLDYRGERDGIDRWSEAKGEAGLEAYWREKNVRSIDGLPTHLMDAEPV